MSFSIPSLSQLQMRGNSSISAYWSSALAALLLSSGLLSEVINSRFSLGILGRFSCSDKIISSGHLLNIVPSVMWTIFPHSPKEIVITSIIAWDITDALLSTWM
jgi:hypothetical protein